MAVTATWPHPLPHPLPNAIAIVKDIYQKLDEVVKINENVINLKFFDLSLRVVSEYIFYVS